LVLAGYDKNWSLELYIIKAVQQTTPITYLLTDSEGIDLPGGFYTQELTKATPPNL